MNRLVLICGNFILVTALFSCNAKNNAPGSVSSTNPNRLSTSVINIPASATGASNGKLPRMVFTDTNYDFGNINEGDKVTHLFVFKNEGQADLVISNATASCGCTKPTFPRGVKHPGDTGIISVTFDSSNKFGKVMKLVTIATNCQPPYRYLTINADIKPSNN